MVEKEEQVSIPLHLGGNGGGAIPLSTMNIGTYGLLDKSVKINLK